MKSRAKLTLIRNQSCYPVFRGFIATAAVFGYISAFGVLLIGALASDATRLNAATGIATAAMGILGCVVIVLITIALKEMALMVADIADCAIWDASSPTNTSAPSGGPATSDVATAQGELTLGEVMRRSSNPG